MGAAVGRPVGGASGAPGAFAFKHWCPSVLNQFLKSEFEQVDHASGAFPFHVCSLLP